MDSLFVAINGMEERLLTHIDDRLFKLAFTLIERIGSGEGKPAVEDNLAPTASTKTETSSEIMNQLRRKMTKLFLELPQQNLSEVNEVEEDVGGPIASSFMMRAPQRRRERMAE